MADGYVREGSSSPIELQVVSNRDALPIGSGTNFNRVEVIFEAQDKNFEDTRIIFDTNHVPPSAEITDGANGLVEVLPSGTEFQSEHRSYRVFMWVYDTQGRKHDVPTRRDLELKVLRN